MPGGLQNTNGFVHSIRDSGSKVNMRFENVTKSQQFKRWFGDSKLVNKDGTPESKRMGKQAVFVHHLYAPIYVDGQKAIRNKNRRGRNASEF